MLFGKKKNNLEDTKKQVVEIGYKKENTVLQSIMRISYTTKDLNEACNKIVQIICQNYSLRYCTLFLNYNGRFKISGTNVEDIFFPRLEDYINQMFIEKSKNNEADAFVLKSETPLNYDTAWDRNVKYMMFSPLTTDSLIGSILIENDNATLSQNEMEVFELIVENVAIILQNLIYFKQIVDAANRDGLTGIYNRHYMNDHLQRVIQSASQSDETFCLAMLDIDHFKNFNDTYGHLHGDKVLKEVSGYIQREIRAYDVIYRYGGEEFIIYFNNLQLETAYEILERLRRGIEALEIKTEMGEVTKVTASFGVAEFPIHDRSIQGLVEKADKAMYVSKESGRNRVTMYDESMASIEAK